MYVLVWYKATMETGYIDWYFIWFEESYHDQPSLVLPFISLYGTSAYNINIRILTCTPASGRLMLHRHDVNIFLEEF